MICLELRKCATRLGAAILAAALVAPAALAQIFDFDRDFREFADQVVASHGLDPAEVRRVLASAEFDQRVLDAISRPAEAMPWYRYRPIFLTEERIAGGVAFWERHQGVLERAEARYGVPPQVVVAIIGVETYYGRRKGKIRVLDSLATLGFRYPRRGKFFRRELAQYLLLVRDEGLDPALTKGSYAGAMGIPQFISSSYRRYAVDFDGDGRRDLIHSVDDAVGSVASYLEAHGWTRGGPVALKGVGPVSTAALDETDLKPRRSLAEVLPEGLEVNGSGLEETPAALLLFRLENADPEAWVGFGNFYAITRYNHSKLYALAVHQLAEAIRSRREGG